jgi:hypothetical protein
LELKHLVVEPLKNVIEGPYSLNDYHRMSFISSVDADNDVFSLLFMTNVDASEYVEEAKWY